MTRRRQSPRDVAAIETWARGDSLVVHEVEDVRVRTWASRGFETEHASQREGLPKRLTPGTYGPFEAGMQVRCRVTKASEHAAQRRPVVTGRKTDSTRTPKARGGRR